MLSSRVVRDGACRITVLVLVQIATFRKGEEATPRLVAHLPRDMTTLECHCNWNTGHHSITIYPVWNLPKMTFHMMLLTFLWLWIQYHNDLVQFWLLFTSTKTIFCLFHVEAVNTTFVKVITAHCVPHECSDLLDDVLDILHISYSIKLLLYTEMSFYQWSCWDWIDWIELNWTVQFSSIQFNSIDHMQAAYCNLRHQPSKGDISG